jgi:ATP-dependent DNA helicase PIF1
MPPFDHSKSFSSISDDDLLRLADDAISLAPITRKALESELDRRTRPDKRSKTSSYSDSPKIGGWLLLYCFIACFVLPIWTLGLLLTAPLWLWLLFLPHSLLSGGAGILLWRRSPKGLHWARLSFLYLFTLTLGFVLLLISVGVGQAVSAFSAAVPSILWWIYFRKSGRVRAVYGQSMRAFWPLFKSEQTAPLMPIGNRSQKLLPETSVQRTLSLEKHQKPTSDESLQRLLHALKSASVVLLHGRAGTGKTTLIRSLQREGLRYVVVAPTGVAALNAGGQTIHKFFGIPPRIVNLNDIRPRARLRSIVRRIDLIVIDEISMVRSDLLDVIDQTLRVNLGVERPFGGMKILLVGDFLQLPPIVEEHDAPILQHRGYDVRHAFGAKSIRNLRDLKVVELLSVYRQNDPRFLELLHNVRIGANLEATVHELNSHCHREHRPSTKPIILTTRTDAAAEYNKLGLAALPGKEVCFSGLIENDFRILRDRLPSPEHLVLKEGARIMMVKNDPEKRWVNGSLGTVARLSATAIWVRLDESSRSEEVKRTTWESVEYQYDKLTQRVDPVVVGTYTQFPVVPAWAMTIHKAQGLTLSDVRVDLGHGAFSPGQVYVALSRATTLAGLSFGQPLRVSDIMADTNVVGGVMRMASAQWQ